MRSSGWSNKDKNTAKVSFKLVLNSAEGKFDDSNFNLQLFYNISIRWNGSRYYVYHCNIIMAARKKKTSIYVYTDRDSVFIVCTIR